MERVSDRRTRSPLSVARPFPSDEPLVVPYDGFHTPTIKRHSLKKLRAHNRVTQMFTTAMRDKWELAYIGLYAGAGHARLKDTGSVVETSALSVLRQRFPFKHYIYVENDTQCVRALSHRWRLVAPEANVHVIERDVNESIPEVRAKLPDPGRLLAFCFVDPFNMGVRFETIKALTDLRIDFLILLMLSDARRNFVTYYRDRNRDRIAEFIDYPDWREEFKRQGDPVRFLSTKFDDAMRRCRYHSGLQTRHRICAEGKNVLQYMLTFYSKDEAGTRLWSQCLKSLAKLDDQGTLGLDLV